MDGLRYNTFASSALAGNKNAGKYAGNLADNVTHLLHRLAMAEQAFDASRAENAAGVGKFAAQHAAAPGAIQGKFQSLNVERLVDEIKATVMDGLQALLAAFAFPAVGDHGNFGGAIGGAPQ